TSSNDVSYGTDTGFDHYNDDSILGGSALVLCESSPEMASCTGYTYHGLDDGRQVFNGGTSDVGAKTISCVSTGGTSYDYSITDGSSWQDGTCEPTSSTTSESTEPDTISIATIDGEDGDYQGVYNDGRPYYRFSKNGNEYCGGAGGTCEFKINGVVEYTFTNPGIPVSGPADPGGPGRYEPGDGFLWKSVSEGDGNLAVFLPSSYATESPDSSTSSTSNSGLVQITFKGDSDADLSFDYSNFQKSFEDGAITNVIKSSSMLSFEYKLDEGQDGMEVIFSGIGVYITDAGEAYDSEELKVIVGGTEYFADNFWVDTLPTYGDEETVERSGEFIGATGGTNGDIFKIGDEMKYVPPTENNGEKFTVNLSTIKLTQFLGANDPYTIPEGDADGEYTFAITVDYGGGLEKQFTSPAIKIDNDVLDYSNGGQFYSQDDKEGGSGFNSAFISGDRLKYVPPVYDDGETFTINMSPINLSETAEVEKYYDSDDRMGGDYTGTLNVIATDNAGNVTEFPTNQFTLDTIIPRFDEDEVTAGLFLEFPTNYPVQGVGNIIILRVLTDANGDDVAFTVDFSDIAGDTANYVGQVGDTEIELLEMDLDITEYAKTISFYDDAGNVATNVIATDLTTNVFAVDLIYPVLETSSLLSITSGESPASMGDTVQFLLPTDTRAKVNEEILFSVDLTELGGADANFVQVSETQEVKVVAGSLNSETYEPSFIVYDKALNSISSILNPLLVDNKPPDFDLNCGGTVTVIDNGDSNGIADYTNGAADTVVFNAPDNTSDECDFASFKVNLNPVNRGYESVVYYADGQQIPVTVTEGVVDDDDYTLVITLYDEFNNYQEFASGEFSIDNDIMVRDETIFSESAGGFSTVDEELYPGTGISSTIYTLENDIANIYAEMPGATVSTELSSDNPATTPWAALLNIISGEMTRELVKIFYTVVDDAGNVVKYWGDETFHITNDDRIKHGGGGGTANLHRTDGGSLSKEKRGVVRRQNLEFREKRKEEKLKEGKYPIISENIIHPDKSYFDFFRERLEASSIKQKKSVKRIPKPKLLENGVKRIGFRGMRESEWEKFKDDQGGFRTQNTLKNFKKYYQRQNSQVNGTLRITELSKRGKFAGVRRNQSVGVVK
ncbi:MAG: hypothetical protein OEL89_02360, partial [Candidatus Peregrinibacteria bacterium]|nr:hypothetical protein [Candidatus Peregrinibacteria bacterium]